MNDASLIAQMLDLVIVLTLIECAALALYHRATGKGVAPHDFAANMASGLCLMLALRCVVQDAAATWVAAFLLAAGFCHGIDMWMRWRRGAAASSTTRQVTA